MTKLSRRVEKLEVADKPKRSLPLVIWDSNETEEQARQRWCDGHPGEDLNAASTVLLVRLVSGHTEQSAR
jgi:hypothetical protein